MSSTSEVGHAKNVSNFQDLIDYCTAYGIKYNPSKAVLKLPAVIALHANAETQIETVATTKNAFDTATGDRQTLFEPLQTLATRIINALSATDASENTIEDAKSLNNKLQGIRIGKIVDPPVEGGPQNSSVSRQSFDTLIENFSALIDLLSTVPSYIPNETELTVAALSAYADDLQAANKNQGIKKVDYSNARIFRNEVLYTEKTGLFDIAADIKLYVKSVFKASSPQFKQVSAIKFTNRQD